MQNKSRKVVVIGVGFVGTTYVYALMKSGLASEIVLLDKNTDRVKGEVMDLQQGQCFVPPVNIRPGDYSDCADADLIIVTAGAKQIPGQTRLELIQRNADIVKDICDEIAKHDSNAVMVMVANPVDSLTQVALQRLGWQRERLIGSGTVLDSARFRFLLSRHCGVDARNVHAYILGEHGDSEVAAWSMTHIAGVQIKEYCGMCNMCNANQKHKEIVEQVRDSAYHIIDYKGSTYYAIGLSLMRITEAILRDEKSIMTVSIYLKGEYNIDNVCLSVPCVVGKAGVDRIIQAKLYVNEQKDLQLSAQTLRKVYRDIKI